MNRDIGGVLKVLLALAIFGFIGLQTAGALRASGVWGRGAVALRQAADDPVAPVEAALARTDAAPAGGGTRDPFSLGSAPAPVPTDSKPVVRKPVVPPPPERPVLTAIVWDADPRALVRWNGRDWTVRSGGLFDEFQVVSITRTQVTLSRGSETFVLQLKPQGD